MLDKIYFNLMNLDMLIQYDYPNVQSTGGSPTINRQTSLQSTFSEISPRTRARVSVFLLNNDHPLI